jgi:Raf kinase inhibitor-like YbhB/YbcL family protein
MNIQFLLMTVLAATLQVTSPSFRDNDMIPAKYSCEGENSNPAISVKNIPEGSRSLALILFDPDAKGGGFTHWVMWNIDLSGQIGEHSAPGMQGKNGKGDNAYTGPCPPDGTHHYHFMVYALDTRLDLPSQAGKEQLEAAMKGHILATGELLGLYKKTK